MLERTNGITLSGRAKDCPVFDHEVLGEAFLKLVLRVQRLSGVEDEIPVTVSERLLGDKAVTEGTPLSVKGQIRSYNRRTDDGSHLMLTVFARELDFPGEDLAHVNETALEGRICKPVIYRRTPFSREIADILIAVNRRYGKSDYVPAIAWGRNARFAASLEPGDPVTVRGRFQSRSYNKTLPDGTVEQRTAYELSCSSVELNV